MHMVILTSGSRGDVQPYIALGTGLKAAGYDVTLATMPDYESLATRYGLGFKSVGSDAQRFVQDKLGEAVKGINPLNAISRLRTLLSVIRVEMEHQAADMWTASHDADAIINHFILTPYGLSIADKMNIPFLECGLIPQTPTRAFASPTMPASNLGGILNQLSHHLVEQGIWQMLRGMVNRWRRETLQMPPMPFRGHFSRMTQEHIPRLYAFSPQVIAKPDDWDSSTTVTGYWFLPPDKDWQPPAHLVDFLNNGPPPVYIGFGSMPSQDPAQMTRTILDALKISNQRGILLGGWGGLLSDKLPPTILCVDTIPHDWLFPRTAAVVHHGGAGTTAAGLRAGVPSIVIPYLGDQPFWGRQVYGLGVGPQPIPRQKLTAEKLADAIHTATGDQKMRQQAADLGKKIQAEDGIGRAVEIVERTLSKFQ